MGLVRTVLALMGCAGRAEVALASPRLPVPSLVALGAPQPRAHLLLEAVHQVLRAVALTVQDLDLVVAATGPGSFTGIRNTLACAWGLAQARHIPVHGFPSLLVQATRSREREVLAVQPARKGWVYAQRFVREQRWLAEGEVRVLPLEELGQHPWPVVAPPGLALPPEVSLAETRCAPVEALLELALELTNPDSGTLQPFYVEAFPATRVR